MATDDEIKMIERAQRTVLIGVTRAYRTVSTNALPVIAGVLPIRIALKKRVALSLVRRGIENKFGYLMIEADARPHECKVNIKKAALRLWPLMVGLRLSIL